MRLKALALQLASVRIKNKLKKQYAADYSINSIS